MLQLRGPQHSKHGKTENHQNHFRCTITCGFCGIHLHHDDECHMKKSKSDNLKRQEAERQKSQTPSKAPMNGDKAGKGGAKEAGKDGTPNHNPQRRSSAPATSPSPATADRKKRPQGNSAFPEDPNPKKRRLARSAKSLTAAGMDVKFPDEE